MIVFRCNANPEVGLGHLARCRALAYELKRQGEACVMVGPPKSYANAQDAVFIEDWIEVETWISAAQDAAQLVAIARDKQCNFVVLDDYRVDADYQHVLNASCLHWLQFDGTAKKPLWADLVVNPNPAARADDYVDVLHNPAAKLLLGPCYAVMRAEFPPPGLRVDGRPIEQVVLAFGGGDDKGGIEFAILSLIEYVPLNWRFMVISGANNPRNSQLLSWIEQHGRGRISLAINPNNVAKLFANCDLAVIAGGTTIYEAACCRLPMVLIAIADNQIKQAEAFANAGAALFLGALNEVDPVQLKKVVLQVAIFDVLRHELVVKAGELVDGNGAQRVAKEIMRCL